MKWLSILFIVQVQWVCSQSVFKASPTADFIIPDTACAGQPVNITNLTTGASTYFWKFCTGSTTENPLGINFSNPFTMLNTPVFITLVYDGARYYSFITNLGSGSLVRLDHGTNLMNSPVSGVDLGNLGVLTLDARGIQVKKQNADWYGFILNGTHLIRLEFGSSVTNTPVAVDLGSFAELNEATGLNLLHDGVNWMGFCTNFLSSKLTKFTFGSSLLNTPVVQDLGNVGLLDHPYQFAINKENGTWYMLICNSGSNSLTRLDFGNSLTNLPTGVNLGNLASFEDNRGIVLSSDCERVTGFICQHTTNPDRLARLNFSNGIAGPITAIQIGNIGLLNRPSSFSELIHVGDAAYMFVVNMTNSTLTLLYFPDCSDASLLSSTLQHPPPVYYYTPGTYTVTLIVDEGLATQQTVCKQIVIIPSPVFSLGGDKILCHGNTLSLDPGPGFETYIWSTGATSQTITLDQPGKYWVSVANRQNCQASDTVMVAQAYPDSSSLDTAICFSQRYFAGGSWQSTSGTYKDTLYTTFNCDSIVTTHLTIKPEIIVSLGRDSSICSGGSVLLNAHNAGTTAYLWNDGSTDSVLQVEHPGIYWVHVTVNDCLDGDTIRFGECPPKLWFPAAFTPNGDGLNDYFQPVGVSISKFRMLVFDRTGQMIHESDDVKSGWNGMLKNQFCPSSVYTYKAYYETLDEPGITKQAVGTFTLVR